LRRILWISSGKAARNVWVAALIKTWWAKYKTWIIVLLAIYAVVVLVLILLSRGHQDTPFQYQIF
jgi:hypothetical protein